MCGRYANFLTEQELADAFAIAEAAEDARLLPPSWNIAPTTRAPIVTARESGRTLVAASWGLLPAWAKDPAMASRMFNARSETVAEKPAFRAAFKRRRCLVPANGYYEWQKRGTGKQPFFIHSPDDAPLAFAGLWEERGEGEAASLSFTILTAPAREGLAHIHDREPVMLPAGSRDAWLDPDSGADELHAVIASKRPEVATRPVGRAVGNVRNNGPELIDAIADDA